MSNSVWKCQTEDGKISQISSDSELKSLSSSIGDKPHELSQCTFKILSLHVTPEVEVIPSYYLEIENKSNEHKPNEISTTIGVTCVTEFDRLVDICLTKMILNDVTEFEIECSKAKLDVKIVLQLINFEYVKELYEMTPEELIDTASQIKAHGVTLYSEHRVPDAFYKFSKALKFLVLIEERNENNTIIEAKQKLMTILLGNLAGCHVALKNWDSAIDLCNSVLGNDPHNVKSLFRRGTSLIEIQEFDRARHDLLAVLELEPSNLALKSKLLFLDEKEKAWKHKYASTMRRMFRP